MRTDSFPSASSPPAMLAFILLSISPAPHQETVVERKGPHFTLLSHLERESLADEALAAAEGAWPLALKALGLKEKKLPDALVIHLYPDAESYEAAEQALTGGAFKANLTFSHFETKSAHVALQPPGAPRALIELGLPTLTLYTIAHEAAHLASYAYLSNALDFPEWFAEGMAMHVGYETLSVLGRARPGLAEPLAARNAVRCKELLRKEELPEVGLILGSEIGDLEFDARYAVNQRLYELLLAEHEKDLEKTVKAIKKQGGGEGYRAGLLAELGKIWSDKDRAKLQTEWVASTQAASPEWDEVLHSLETRGADYVQRAFPTSNAVAFRTDALDALPIRVAGTVKTIAGDAHQMNFLLGRTTKGFLSVGFSFGQNVTLFRCDFGAKDTWTILGTAECADLKIGTDVPFRIEANAAELVVFVAEKEALRAPLKGRSPLGPWGLGAQANTTGEWKNLVVGPAK